MDTCKQCTFFFSVPEGADDYEQGHGDCVNEKVDEKGKYWLSKPVTEQTEQCSIFQKR